MVMFSPTGLKKKFIRKSLAGKHKQSKRKKLGWPRLKRYPQVSDIRPELFQVSSWEVSATKLCAQAAAEGVFRCQQPTDGPVDAAHANFPDLSGQVSDLTAAQVSGLRPEI